MSNLWELYWGIVAEDKEFTSKELKVYVQELLPAMTESGDFTEQQTVNIIDMTTGGKAMQSSVKNTNIVIAEYADLFSNRVGPPDMCKDEQVFVFRYSDTDRYFWFPTGRDDNLRRLERFRLAISDDDTLQKELTDDNTYYIDMDTLHGKHIVLSTAKSNGESYRYFIRMDAETNSIKIYDDGGNEIVLESGVPRIRLKNSKNAAVDVIGQDVVICAPRDLVLKADRQVLINTNSMTQEVTQAIVLNATEVALKGGNITSGGKSGTIGLNGAVKIDGPLVSGYVTAEGYSVRGIGTPYGEPSIALEDGSSFLAQPERDEGAGADENRHAAAQEQVLPMMQIIQAALIELNNNIIKLNNNAQNIFNTNVADLNLVIQELAERIIECENATYGNSSDPDPVLYQNVPTLRPIEIFQIELNPNITTLVDLAEQSLMPKNRGI